jgi:hypothetical protein
MSRSSSFIVRRSWSLLCILLFVYIDGDDDNDATVSQVLQPLVRDVSMLDHSGSRVGTPLRSLIVTLLLHDATDGSNGSDDSDSVDIIHATR